MEMYDTIAGNLSPDKNSRKQRREERINKKVSSQVDNEFSNYGIDQPEQAQNENSIDNSISAIGDEKIKSDLTQWSNLYPKAPQETAVKPDRKEAENSVRLQRKKRFTDALIGIGTILTGSDYSVDENSRAAAIARERDEKYQEYKNIVKNNQRTRAVWEAQKGKEALSYLDKLKEEAKNEPAKQIQLKAAEQQLKNYQQQYELNQKEADLREREFNAREKGGYYNSYNRRSQSSSDEFSLDDVSLSPPEEMAINEIANMGGDASATYSNRIRRSIIESLYDKITTNGKTTLVSKPGADNVLKELSAKADEINQLSIDIKAREKALEKVPPGMGNPDDETKLEADKARLTQLRKELKQTLNAPAQAAPTGAMQTQSTGGKSTLDAILDKTK